MAPRAEGSLRVRLGISVPTMGAEAPGSRGATSAAYPCGTQATEQRSEPGCLGVQIGIVIPGRALSGPRLRPEHLAQDGPQDPAVPVVVDLDRGVQAGG